MNKPTETLMLAAPPPSWWATYATLVARSLPAVAMFVFRVVWWPIANLLVALRVLFSPVTYTVQYLAAPFIFALCLVPKLEVLYIFFGTAALVGTIAGLSISITSTGFTQILGISGPDSSSPSSSSSSTTSLSNRTKPPYPHATQSSTPTGSLAIYQRREYADSRGSLDNDLSSQDSDYSWHNSSDKTTLVVGSSSSATGTGTGVGTGVGGKSQRHLPGRLVSQTIHEEDDSV
ncbi:hypothetical protein B0T19DRAFT_192030 [Cercophora scortea]|uniref:Uncharacterized protein n=1 Tax=Cercophora scortea TaxID=314031 RepID=A0AAE0INY8_9PEZI|nr:hypothetical protein B0T19DRAFT_192030 [Cercophora scortea]